MHKVMFAKGIGGTKEFWRMSTLNDLQKGRGCFTRLGLYEDNARFILLAILLLLYLVLGAVMFMFIERDNEAVERQAYTQLYGNFVTMYCSNNNQQLRINCTLLDELLNVRGKMSMAGLMSPRKKWDFSGAFYFASTVISTLGFGMTIPRTALGRWVLVFYGFIGCSCCILFFNLFLERIVTLLAYMLRWYNDCKIILRARATGKTVESLIQKNKEIDTASVTESNSDPWKPSVYKVLFCLLLFTVFLILTSASVYSCMESWSYSDSIYYCFVAFATIGFGDFVSSQNSEEHILYRIFNIVALILGICCVYTLFNVFSIIIRQILNKIIKTLNFKCRCRRHRRRQRYLGLGLRPPPACTGDLNCDSEPDSHDSSNNLTGGRIVSLKEFLEQNKANMLMIQRQLIQSARDRDKEGHLEDGTSISANQVGPLAILTYKFGEDA